VKREMTRKDIDKPVPQIKLATKKVKRIKYSI